VGRWRDLDAGLAIDARDEFFDGSNVAGVVGLREFLLGKRELFVQTAVEKLMAYALGRSLTPADQPTVREILRTAAGDDYAFSAIVLKLVASAPFQMRTAPSEPEAQIATAAR
jgi:hypothetical protein